VPVQVIAWSVHSQTDL